MNISPRKTSAWLAAENVNLRILVIAMATWALCFYRPILGHSYTSWDTHDLGFVNFLYFSDALKNGGIPLWNHFIQSGTFFPNFNNIGLYSPFQLTFVALSWVISPVYAYELMIQAAVLIGGVGSYLLFRTYTSDRLIALFGATAFAVTVLVPIVGQIVMVISLSSLPWLILACTKIIEGHDNEGLRYVIWGIVGALYVASGYLWMNLMHLIIVAIFSLGMLVKKYIGTDTQGRETVVSSAKNLLLFIGTVALLYGCFVLPGYFSINFNYGLLEGNYESPEPRLRSLNVHEQYLSFRSIYDALVGAIDFRIVTNNESWLNASPKWSFGAGWVLWIVFLVTLRKKLSGQQIFWITLMLVALMYSAGNTNFVGDLAKHTPIISANRWWFNGIFYVAICLIFLVVTKISSLQELRDSPGEHGLRMLLVGVLALCLLVYFRSPAFEFGLVAISLTLVWLLGRERSRTKWSNLLTALIVVNVLAIASAPYSHIQLPPRYLPALGDGGYSQQVLGREKQAAITQNARSVGAGHDYIFNDENWLLKKIPFSHGYNNLGNPYYWYVKNDPFLERLVVVTQGVRRERELERKDFPSDNKFVEAMMGDVLADMDRPTIEPTHFRSLTQRPDFRWQLNELKIEPNTASMRVSTEAAAFLIFNNVDHPGWDVYVNGKKAELVRANRIFQGVFLERAGSYDVTFKFRPVLTILLMLLPYLILILCLIVYMQKARRWNTSHAN